jgi:hypothetical protein
MAKQTQAQLNNLGSPVTSQNYSWGDIVRRAWGSEFNAPDHNTYQFSGRNYDSTDRGLTGIYARDNNLGWLLDNAQYPDMPIYALTDPTLTQLDLN